MAIWLGMFLLTASWLFLIPVYVPAGAAWVVFLAAGVCFILSGCRSQEEGDLAGCRPREEPDLSRPRPQGERADTTGYPSDHGDPSPHTANAKGPSKYSGSAKEDGPENKLYRLSRLWPLLPLLVAAAVGPLSWKLPAVLLAGGILSALYLQPKIYLVRGLWLAGTVMLLQNIALQVFWKLGPRLQEEYLFGRAAAWIGSLIGLQPAVNGSTLFLNHPAGPLAFAGTWDKFGLLFLLLTLAGSLAIFLFFRPGVKPALLRIAGALLLYGLTRYLLILAMLADGGQADIFWSRTFQIASWLSCL